MERRSSGKRPGKADKSKYSQLSKGRNNPAKGRTPAKKRNPNAATPAQPTKGKGRATPATPAKKRTSPTPTANPIGAILPVNPTRTYKRSTPSSSTTTNPFTRKPRTSRTRSPFGKLNPDGTRYREL